MTFLRPFFYSIVIYFSVSTGLAEESDEDEVQKLPGTQAVIELNNNVQKISGLKTIVVKLAYYQPEFITYGKAINVKPLLDIRRRYLIASSQHSSAKAKYGVTQKSLSRLQSLHKKEAVSTRKLQEQQSQWQSDKAILNKALLRDEMILVESRLRWGDTLTRWFTQLKSPQVDNISANRSQLLQVILPAGQQMPEGTKTIKVAVDGSRKNAVPADFISAAPQIEPFSQGAAYFFLSSSPVIQTGMHVTAWIPSQKQDIQGIIIPRSALLWHLGQAFVFVKLNDDSFSHRNIDHYVEIPDGYFIASGIEDGEELVRRGGQMLLSHEFRSQIPDEDDDD